MSRPYTETIALINGSMNQDSYTRKLLEKVESRIKERGFKSTFIDVREINAPIYVPDAQPPKCIVETEEKLIGADGIVVGSPEYHGSFSGALKNLLDYYNSSHFKDKPIALVTTTGGVKAGTNTMNHLRLVFRNLHGLVIPPQFAISKKEATSELLFDDNMNARLETLVSSLEKEMKKKTLYENYFNNKED
ncbi:NAD(P)H-dependent oxidoreductase [Bacillus shivajii]|uniref:NADPH-dependent FMN reductase n=1 Tax=Bacillus shivajii TaxID=1983719 RepID=UPI001CFB41C3|nr:NAD(P)H-dependent oxidoreductase [Bacillus shivajii]UCZ53651.1 NAD(P)H-dependent oxidoreductase [Bacillus shivajii]